jgi:flagellar M-ring protein FliF
VETKGQNATAGQLTEFFGELSLRQKAVLGGGAVAVAITLFLFVQFANGPDYKVLYSGMKADEAQSLSASLAAKGIKAQISPDGTTVSVPADKLDAGRLEVASAGTPRSGRMGFELFDKLDWASSDFDHKVNYQRAIEGELERTIQTLSGVEAVRVHVVMPTDSVFAEREHKAKASVILRMHGAGISDASQAAIARLVASAVEQLDPQDVTIVDAMNNRPVGGGQSSAAAAEDQLTRRLMATLGPVTGPERVRATVQVESDPSTTEESEEKYDPASTVALTMQRTEERSGAGAAAIGVAGTASNLPGATSGAPSRTGEDSQASKSENGTYAVNRTTRRTVHPAGRIRRITAAVVVDDALEYKADAGQQKQSHRRRTAEEMKQIEELTRAAIGFDATRGDVVSVQNVSFAAPPAIDLPVPGKLQRVQRVANDWSNVLRYILLAAVFGVVYLLFIRPVKRQFLSIMKQLPKRPMPLPADAGNTIEGNNVLGAMPEAADAKRAQALKKQVLDKVVSQPVTASRLVQGWIGEGGR